MWKEIWPSSTSADDQEQIQEKCVWKDIRNTLFPHESSDEVTGGWECLQTPKRATFCQKCQQLTYNPTFKVLWFKTLWLFYAVGSKKKYFFITFH